MMTLSSGTAHMHGDAKFAKWRPLFDNQFKFMTSDCDIWKCEYISRNALQHLYTTQSSKGTERGHAVHPSHISVRENIEQFIKNWDISPTKAVDQFIANDKTTIITNQENKDNVQCSDALRIPNDLFACGGRCYKFNKKEKLWVAETVKALWFLD